MGSDVIFGGNIICDADLLRLRVTHTVPDALFLSYICDGPSSGEGMEHGQRRDGRPQEG